MEVQIKVHKNWLKFEKELMVRLHDWWAELRGDTLVLATRYSQPKLDALAAWCRLTFGPDI